MNVERTEADPILAEQARQRTIRKRILRSGLFWTPLFLICGGALIFFFIDRLLGLDNGGTWFLVVVLSLFTALTGSQSIQAIADLAGSPQTSVGEVRRRWSKLDSFVMRTHYIRLESTILRGDTALLDGIRTGDKVTARYYKHSGVLISISKLEPVEEAPVAPPVSEPPAVASPGPAWPAPAEPLDPPREKPKANKVEF